MRCCRFPNPYSMYSTKLFDDFFPVQSILHSTFLLLDGWAFKLPQSPEVNVQWENGSESGRQVAYSSGADSKQRHPPICLLRQQITILLTRPRQQAHTQCPSAPTLRFCAAWQECLNVNKEMYSHYTANIAGAIARVKGLLQGEM